MSFGIFANDIGDRAVELENAAEAGNIDLVKSKNQNFIDDAMKLVDDNENALNELVTDDPKPVMERPDNEILLKLLNASAVYDMNKVEKIMADIEQHQYSTDDGLSIWLRSKVNAMHYSEIVDKISALIK